MQFPVFTFKVTWGLWMEWQFSKIGCRQPVFPATLKRKKSYLEIRFTNWFLPGPAKIEAPYLKISWQQENSLENIFWQGLIIVFWRRRKDTGKLLFVQVCPERTHLLDNLLPQTSLTIFVKLKYFSKHPSIYYKYLLAIWFFSVSERLFISSRHFYFNCCELWYKCHVILCAETWNRIYCSSTKKFSWKQRR